MQVALCCCTTTSISTQPVITVKHLALWLSLSHSQTQQPGSLIFRLLSWKRVESMRRTMEAARVNAPHFFLSLPTNCFFCTFQTSRERERARADSSCSFIVYAPHSALTFPLSNFRFTCLFFGFLIA